MSKLSPARSVALSLLSEQRRREAYIHEVARSSDVFNTLDERDRNFCMRLVTGVNITLGFLDLQLVQLLSKPNKLEPRVHDAMRLATFEILFMGPVEAAVDQGVELVKSVQPYAAGMANAVLRRVAKKQKMMQVCQQRAHEIALSESMAFEELSDVDLKALEAVCGYPAWLTQCLVENMPPYLAARLVLDALHAAPSSQAHIDESLIPCDISAQCIATLAAAPGAHVLEVGQGRGTKSLIMASLGSKVSGCDLYDFKALETERRASFYGYSSSISATAFDATRLTEQDIPAELTGPFESVLVDAPCSGTGTMRRHPEIPWHLEQDAVDPGSADSLCKLQLRLLKAASTRVAEGGQLMYSTCSVLKAENEWVVNAFLSSEEGKDFKRQYLLGATGADCLDEFQMEHVENWLTPEGAFQSYPCAGAPDGHFCARFVKA